MACSCAGAVANPTATEVAAQKSGAAQEELPSSEPLAAPEAATAAPAAAAAAPSEAPTSSGAPAVEPVATAAAAQAAAVLDKPPASAGPSQAPPLTQQQNGAGSTPVSPSASLPRPESSAQMQVGLRNCCHLLRGSDALTFSASTQTPVSKLPDSQDHLHTLQNLASPTALCENKHLTV